MTDNKFPKRPSGDDIRGRLLEGNFGAFGTPSLAPSDPISVTQMVLKLSEIKPYDKNPRRIINPKYREIKDSIRNQRGLSIALGITRRPGEEYYMVQSGGNTRLRVLKELYQETRDEAFNTVHCLFYPWVSESSVLTAHFIENELRGTMEIVDKAYGIQMLRAELEQELGNKISDREFVRRLTEKGFKLSNRQARRLAYVLELDQIIPIAIREGMTSRDIDIIKNTEQAYSQFCEGKTNQFAILFAKTMSERDGEYFDLNRVRTVLERELGDLLKIPYNRIALDIEAILQQQAINRRNDMSLLTEPMEPEEGGMIATSSTLGFYTLTQDFDTGIPAYQIDNESTPVKHEQPVPLATSRRSTGTTSTPPVARQVVSPVAPTAISDLVTLQQQNYELAKQIARTAALENVVIQRSEGVGFELEQTDRANATVLQWGVWWLLQGLALSYREVLPNCLRVPEQPLIDVMGKPVSWSVVPYRLINDPTLLSDQAWQAIVKLIDNCRNIRRQAEGGCIHSS